MTSNKKEIKMSLKMSSKGCLMAMI